MKLKPIELLFLPERYYNALIANKIYDIEDLAKYSEEELLTMWLIGPRAIDAIKQSLKKHDLTLQN